MNRIKNALHIVYPVLAYLRYGRIGKRITVIGITGTDGKSSSVILTANILRTQGYRVAHFSSVSMHDGSREMPNDMKMTTPGRMRLHRFLAQAEKDGITHAVVEITSQGMLQHRHRLIGFSAIGITNITPEHIEAHRGFDAYRKTKLLLAHELLPKGAIVVPYSLLADVAETAPKGVRVLSCGIGEGDVSGVVQANTLSDTVLSLSYGSERKEISIALGGPFIAHNLLFASAIAVALGTPLAVVKRATANQVSIRGRCEVVSVRPRVIVDYAHTLAALDTLLPYVKAQTQGKLIHVFGAAGGGRDRYKRPLLAKRSERYADISIITEENPFDEREGDIEAEIRAGFSSSYDVRTAPKREDAVHLARELAGPEDTILLTGKGSESVIAGAKRSRRPYAELTYTQCIFGTP